MNKLSFKYEITKMPDGRDWYNFFYLIDGKEIDYGAYIPVDCQYIVNHDLYSHVYIQICDCGCDGCGCVFAKVEKTPSSYKWFVSELREEENFLFYEFEKENYRQVMTEVMEVAKKAYKILFPDRDIQYHTLEVHIFCY